MHDRITSKLTLVTLVCESNSICREELADLTMEDIALAIAMESLEDIDGWVVEKRLLF